MSVRASAARPGDQLPPLAVDVTRTLVVAGAIASRDFQDVHHDPALAAEHGSKDVFMNIHTTNGLVGRFVTDWAGPDAVLRKVAIRLGVPAYPGDTLTFSGRVTGVGVDGTVEVEVRGGVPGGDHVSGTVTLELPV